MKNANDNWLLQELHIHKSWNGKGTFDGNVKFQNGVKMEFSLLLDHEKCSKMIAILKDELVASAVNLGDMMVKSLPVALPVSAESVASTESEKPVSA
jgi:hypothetical protein